MSFMWRKKPTPAPQPAPARPPAPLHRPGNNAGWRRKHTAGLAHNGTLDALVDEFIWLIKGDGERYFGKANNVYLTEMMRVRQREFALLDHKRTMKVMIALGEQRSKNDAVKRRLGPS